MLHAVAVMHLLPGLPSAGSLLLAPRIACDAALLPYCPADPPPCCCRDASLLQGSILTDALNYVMQAIGLQPLNVYLQDLFNVRHTVS